VLENIPTFVTEFGSRDFLVRDEKGIRCETGAVPAAVSLYEKIFRNLATVDSNRWEGVGKQGEPEDLPDQQVYHSFRDKSSEMNKIIPFIRLL